jgi:DNA helicase II / ATP-dependent DNA helicase PcrA
MFADKMFRSKKIISKLLKRHRSELDDKNISLRDVTVLSLISKAKSKGLSLKEYIEAVNAPEKPLPDDVKATVATVYEDYTKTLQKSNSLDFDDLLCFGVKLFGNKKVVHWCRHVLVDEL